MTQTASYDAIIVGAGQARSPLSIVLARAGWKTALIEREHVGGTCINEGYTPTKTRIASREILPAGKILALFSSTHWDVYRKFSAYFVLLLVFPSGLFLLRSRVRYLMRGVRPCRVVCKDRWTINKQEEREAIYIHNAI